MANEYVQAVSFKETLNLQGVAFADADIVIALEAASRGVEKLCKRRFYPDEDANQVRYYTPVSRDLVRVDDLLELTSLATDPGGDGTYEEAWTLNTDFVLEPYNAPEDDAPWELITRHPAGSRVFPARYPRSVRVTAKFGWDPTPPAVIQATTILAAKLMRRAREAPFGVVSVGFDGVAVRIARSDPDIGFLLRPFIRGGMGFA